MTRENPKERRAVTINGVVHDPGFGKMSPAEHAELVADIRNKIEEGAVEADRGELIDGESAMAYVRSLRNQRKP